MMNRLGNYLCVFLLVIPFFGLQAQEKELFIEYRLSDPSVGVNQLEVLSKGNCTISTIIRRMTSVSGIVYGRRGEIIDDTNMQEEEREDRYHVFKDASKNLLICCDDLNSSVIIKESLDLFQWQLTAQKDTLLGYVCQRAKTHFRGRDYTVWFTSQLPFKAAPWKFHGLPGVVLKAESDDEFFKTEAIRLEVRNSKKVIVNPYKIKDAISWEEHKKRYIEYHKKNVAQVKAAMAKLNLSSSQVVPGSSKKEIIVERNKFTFQQMMKKQKEASKK